MWIGEHCIYVEFFRYRCKSASRERIFNFGLSLSNAFRRRKSFLSTFILASAPQYLQALRYTAQKFSKLSLWASGAAAAVQPPTVILPICPRRRGELLQMVLLLSPGGHFAKRARTHACTGDRTGKLLFVVQFLRPTQTGGAATRTTCRCVTSCHGSGRSVCICFGADSLLALFGELRHLWRIPSFMTLFFSDAAVYFVSQTAFVFARK